MNSFPPGYEPQKDSIEVVPSDLAWPSLFLKEKETLEKALLGLPVLAIEHFGSTSVSGLAAKPILYIMVGLESKEFWFLAQKRLEPLGYHCWSVSDEDMLLIKGLPPWGQKRTHHTHFYDFQGPRWKKELAFRDHLRAHPVEAARYEALKKELALKFATNREAYTEGKINYIQEVLKKIG